MSFSARSGWIGITMLLVVLGTGRVEAFTSYFTAFTNLYPQTVGTRIGNTSCMVCHTLPTSGPRNSYGLSFEGRANHSSDPSAALIAIEGANSDGDNFNNITEIRDLSFPWAAGDVPAAPSVSISSPASGTIYTTGQTVQLAATASDNVGVTRVEFYDGATLRGTDTASPFAFSWTFTSADNGTHAWTARAFDAAGLSRTSAVVNLTVNTALGTPTNIVAVVSGTNLTLSWPANRIGSRLLAQTNRITTGISTNLNDFATVAGSTATNRVTVPIDRSNRTRFYKLIYP